MTVGAWVSEVFRSQPSILQLHYLEIPSMINNQMQESMMATIETMKTFDTLISQLAQNSLDKTTTLGFIFIMLAHNCNSDEQLTEILRTMLWQDITDLDSIVQCVPAFGVSGE